MDTPDAIPCLIVGAGPTGLALAAQLQSFGTRFRIIDRALDRAHESRALAVQARTLEVLDRLGLGDPLVACGSTSTRVVVHLGPRVVARATLGDIGADDTRYPFILFVSQAETERILGEHLVREGVAVERGLELVSFEPSADGVQCLLRDGAGAEQRLWTQYLVGCDGAHSAVRRGAGFSFAGGSYPEDFVLGDVEADGPLEPGAINSFVGRGGVAMFFPLGTPRTWRVIAMKTGGRQPAAAGALTLDELQSIVALPTEGSVTVRDPAWLSHFRLHHRQIDGYRRGRVFLAGDAAHIHSPVGAQGMNTGIQDAWNLGWKLALVLRGAAGERLLDSYDAERWRVGRSLLRSTDRVFSWFVRGLSAGRLASAARALVVPRVLPRLLRSSWLRATAFRFASELRIHYRQSAAVTEGAPRPRRGPRAGDRLPDARVSLDGHPTWLQRAVIGPHLSLLLCGDPDGWDAVRLAALAQRRPGLLCIHRLARAPGPGVLVDGGAALDLLGAGAAAQYLVRPDGYVAFRCGGYDLDAVTRYLGDWF